MNQFSRCLKHWNFGSLIGNCHRILRDPANGGEKLGIRNSPRGFTLVEMVIVLGIFLVASTAATSIFVSANKASRRTVGITRTGSDARWAMEKMVEDIRLGTVDYTLTPMTSPTNVLFLRTIDGQSIGYRSLSNRADVCGDVAISCLAVSYNNGPLASMTPKGIDVRRLNFYVWPASDPFTETPTVTTELGQPRVTIVLETATVTPKREEQARLSLETTVSTRIYKR